MPYDTPYNRNIAREVDYINQRYVTHSDMTGQGTVDYRMSGQGMSGGFLGALAGPLLGAVAGPLINKIFGGGPGVAEFKSASASKKSDDNESVSDCECEGESKCGGANPRAVGGAILGFQEGTILGRPKRNIKPLVKPESSFSSLGIPNRPVAEVTIGNANKVLSQGQALAMLGERDRPMRGMGKRGRPSKKGGAGMFEKALKTADPENPPAFLVQQILDSMVTTKEYRGVEGEKQRQAQMRETAKKIASQRIRDAQAKKEGSGLISSLGIPVVSGIAGLFGLGKKRGRPSKKQVGGGPEMSHAKVTVKATRGKPEKVVEKSQMVGSTMSGFGKPKGKSKRAEIVKKVMRERGLSMIEASKVVKAEGLY